VTSGKPPVTPAVRVLRRYGVAFTHHLYDYQAQGGTAQGAEALGIAEHGLIKTLVMEDDHKNPFIVLMHGDCQVSTKALARALGVKAVQPCSPQAANKLTGYSVGGISPFGMRTPLPVYIEASILALPEIYINGGKRGYLVRLDPADLRCLLQATPVQVAIPA
jgi:Cys-tRNA(Pro) deacylase